MDSSVDDDAKLLLDHPELQQAVNLTKDIKHAIETFLPVRKDTIAKLQSLKIDVEESYDKSRKSKIAGTVATVVGSSMAVVGFGLSFVTFGASVGLGVAGTVLVVAGGATMVGADVGYRIYSSTRFKAAKEACETDRKMMEKFEALHSKLIGKIRELENKSSLTIDRILQVVIGIAKSGRPVARAAIILRYYKLADSSLDFVKAAFGFSSALTRAGIGARTVWSGLNVAGRALSVTGVVFSAVLIPVDLGIMLKSAYDVHKYDGGKGKSNSSTAKRIGQLISNIEEQQKEIIRLRDTLV